jgi:hypothetical protein
VAETVTLREHLAALRTADHALAAERDRRYTEVGAERAKALKIKEQADETALGLDREIRAYKDEKANNLRDQIASERGMYVTHSDLKAAIDRIEALIKPLAEYSAAQQGSVVGASQYRSEQRLNVNTVLQVLALLATAIIIFAAFRK